MPSKEEVLTLVGGNCNFLTVIVTVMSYFWKLGNCNRFAFLAQVTVILLLFTANVPMTACDDIATVTFAFGVDKASGEK